MLEKIVNILTRISGLIITAILIIQPWLLSVQSPDPFLFSGWAHITASFISLLVCSTVLSFFRPKKGYVTITTGLLLLFSIIIVSLYYTHYTICFKSSMISIGLLSCLGGLRLLRKEKDNYRIAGMIALSGFFMATYAICQACGHDFLLWESKYKIVGTLTNPNFLGIFLCLTSAITFGLFSELYYKNKKHSLVFLLFFIFQLAVVLMLNKTGHYISLAFMAFIWVCSKYFKKSGKISKKSPILAGLILAIVFLIAQWSIFSATTSFDWEKITSVPSRYQTIVSRLILWQMGFKIFTNHPLTGTGPGSIAYLMPIQRPPTGSTLGLSIYNDDPHSFIVTTLAETGIFGLLGISILLVSIYGCFLRKNTRFENNFFLETSENSPTETDKNIQGDINFPWLYTSIAILILYLAFQSGFIKSIYLPIAISAVIILFGIFTKTPEKTSFSKDYYHVGKSTLTAIMTFAFYSMFNNSFSILPLSGFIILLISLHFSCCQPDVVFKKRITVISLSFIALPIIYLFASYHFYNQYQQEQEYFNAGVSALHEGKWEEAEQYFQFTIKSNPQSLKAYYGLAMAQDSQQKFDEAQDTLILLDNLVPNVFNVKYEIARILFDNNKILDAHRYAIKNLEWATNPLSYEMLGKILLVEGRTNEAEKTFKEGLLSIPPYTKERLAADRIHLSLSALASNKGDFVECKKHLDAITTEVAQNIDALYLKGMLLTREKKYDKALKIFNEALQLYPHVPRILNAVGYLLMVTDQDLNRAQVLLEEAYKIIRESEQPELTDLLMVANSLGKLYQKQNKLTQAGELLKLSYEGTPNEWENLKEERLKDLNDFYNSFSAAE